MSSPARPLQIARDAAPRPEFTSLSQNNPFRIPSDNEIFAIRDRLRNQRATERQTMQNTAQYLRGVARPRETFRHLTELPPPKGNAEEEALAQLILSPDSKESVSILRVLTTFLASSVTTSTTKGFISGRRPELLKGLLRVADVVAYDGVVDLDSLECL